MAQDRLGSKFDRLSLIPVQELRKYLTDNIAKTEDDKKKLERATQRELIAFAKTKNISKDQIEEIFEECRYAKRLSFYLYLIPEAQKITHPLEDILEYKPMERKLNPNLTAYEDLPPVTNLKFLDIQSLDDETSEIGFKYHSIYRYLKADETEQPDHIYETDYGHLWVNFQKGFAVIITSDKRITRQVEIAFHNIFRIALRRPALTKKLINDHFPLESSRGLTYNIKDDAAAVSKKYSTSGKSLFESQVIGQEIRDLENSNATRPNMLYDELIDEEEKRSSNISVSANQAKICLYSKFKASTVRKWFLERAYILMSSLDELYSSDIEEYLKSIKFEQLEKYRVEERKVITSLAAAAWKWVKGGAVEVPFGDEARNALKTGSSLSPYSAITVRIVKGLSLH